MYDFDTAQRMNEWNRFSRVYDAVQGDPYAQQTWRKYQPGTGSRARVEDIILGIVQAGETGRLPGMVARSGVPASAASAPAAMGTPQNQRTLMEAVDAALRADQEKVQGKLSQQYEKARTLRAGGPALATNEAGEVYPTAGNYDAHQATRAALGIRGDRFTEADATTAARRGRKAGFVPDIPLGGVQEQRAGLERDVAEQARRTRRQEQFNDAEGAGRRAVELQEARSAGRTAGTSAHRDVTALEAALSRRYDANLKSIREWNRRNPRAVKPEPEFEEWVQGMQESGDPQAGRYLQSQQQEQEGGGGFLGTLVEGAKTLFGGGQAPPAPPSAPSPSAAPPALSDQDRQDWSGMTSGQKETVRNYLKSTGQLDRLAALEAEG